MAPSRNMFTRYTRSGTIRVNTVWIMSRCSGRARAQVATVAPMLGVRTQPNKHIAASGPAGCPAAVRRIPATPAVSHRWAPKVITSSGERVTRWRPRALPPSVLSGPTRLPMTPTGEWWLSHAPSTTTRPDRRLWLHSQTITWYQSYTGLSWAFSEKRPL